MEITKAPDDKDSKSSSPEAAGAVDLIKKEEEEKKKKMWRKLLVLPYFLGLFWTCLHPLVSVLTGELKCRGWYLDESAIEIRHSNSKSSSNQSRLNNLISTRLHADDGDALQRQLLCDGLSTNNLTTKNLSCQTHADGTFQMATVVPIANAVDPTNEAIVFVVPAPGEGTDWLSSTLHLTYLEMLRRLADPVETPWLAKTIILVAPSDSNSSLENTVSIFLDAYLGPKFVSSQVRPPLLLPPKSSMAILRQLIVLDVKYQSTTTTAAAVMNRRQRNSSPPKGQTDFSILPQGRRGVLPNLDLINLFGKLFHRASFLNKKLYDDSSFLTHGYAQQYKAWDDYIQNFSPDLAMTNTKSFMGRAKIWARDMINLAFFTYTMAVGPFPPHSEALDRGIDSLTIQASFHGQYRKDPCLELMDILENSLRALSNLHERLHHSFVLYWMPSPDKFVSHMEFMLPNILLLLPIAIRGFGMMLEGEGGLQLHLKTIGLSFLLTIMSMVSMLFISLILPTLSHYLKEDDEIRLTNTCLLVLYLGVAYIVKTKILSLSPSSSDGEQQQDDGNDNKEGKRRQRQSTTTSSTTIRSSLQFAACIVAAYTLVPIVFAHAALAYVPSMIFVPFIAFPDYGTSTTTTTTTTARRNEPSSSLLLILIIIAWFLTLPPILLVPRIFTTYTTFIRYAYIPLHVQWLILILSKV